MAIAVAHTYTQAAHTHVFRISIQDAHVTKIRTEANGVQMEPAGTRLRSPFPEALIRYADRKCVSTEWEIVKPDIHGTIRVSFSPKDGLRYVVVSGARNVKSFHVRVLLACSLSLF